MTGNSRVKGVFDKRIPPNDAALFKLSSTTFGDVSWGNGVVSHPAIDTLFRTRPKDIRF
jgi:hypothetical protein